MVKYTIEQIKKSMENISNIRNISVIAHVDHGKSTLTDSLVAKSGLISEDNMGESRFTDSIRADQIQRGITIKSTSVSLYYERKEKENKKEEEKENDNNCYLINLIDSPGHVDFSSEVSAALRVSDGALVVVDCIEGVCVQTETVLKQSISERIRPILFLNKLDRIFLEIQLSNEECYKSLRTSIESVNVICSTYKDDKLGNIELIPSYGNVGFGSGLQAWGFTLETFSKMYSGKFAMSKKLIMNKLWGENYWDNKNKIWLNKSINKNGDILERGFCQFILSPIKILFNSIINEKNDIYESIINSLNIKLKKEDYKLKPKELLKLIMRTWLSAGDCLFNMIIDYLPSPLIAQNYRIENLYSGPLDTEESYAIQTCNKKGPMTMYISKMIPTSQKGRFVAFGRVFSGIIKVGQEIRILGPEYEHGNNNNHNKNDLYIDKIKGILLMMGNKNEIISDCPCGNVCSIIGIDQYLLKSGTITNSINCYPFHVMKFSVSAVVQIAVEPKNASDLPLLIEGLKKLSKSDPLVKINCTKSGQHIISGAGSLHLEICLNDLKNDYMKGNDIKISKPMVSYCETISNKSGNDNNYPNICVSKSPNKHNRLYVSSLPLNDKLIISMEKQEIKLSLFNDIKEFAKIMNDNYNYDLNEAKKIWTFGCPPDGIANLIMDNTKGVQYLNEVKDHIIGAFMHVTCNGVLCDENMRGIQFNIEDVKLHSDRTHRNQGQLYQCSTRVFYACEIASQPKIVEPMYLVEITVPKDNVNNVYQTINNKRGKIINVIDKHPLMNIKGYLPVLESFDFTELLRKNTGGKAFPQMSFSHWSIIESDPFVKDTLANKIVLDVRKRKGLKVELPNFNTFYDKI